MYWTVATRGLAQLSQYAVSVVLARLLVPSDFGLVAMVTVVTGFATLFVDLGIGSAIVQRKELAEVQLRSAYTATVGAGLALTAILFVSAPMVAAFYGQPELAPITRLTALTFLMVSLGIVPRAMMLREMLIKRLVLLDLSVSLSGNLIAVILALNGFGLWTLVLATLWNCAGQAIGPTLFGGWRPGFSSDLRSLKPILRFSASVVAFDVLNYWARNIDNLLIGRLLGTFALGVYTRGYSLMLLPLTQITGALSSTMLSAMSRMQGDLGRTKHAFLRAIGLVAFVSLPVMLGLCAVADTFVRVIYGGRWIDLVPVLRLLAIVGAIQSVVHTTGWIYLSQGRADRQFRWGLAACPVIIFILSFAAFFTGTVTGVAGGYLVANVLLFVPAVRYAGALIGVSLSDVLRAVTGSTLLACVMSGVVWTVGLALRSQTDLPLFGVLLIEVCIGIVTYSGLSWAFGLAPLDELNQIRLRTSPAEVGNHGSPGILR